MIRRPPRSTLFPYRRSSDLRRTSATRRTAAESGGSAEGRARPGPLDRDEQHHPLLALHRRAVVVPVGVLARDVAVVVDQQVHRLDRKSTRLNSSHANISYAV